MNRTCRRLAALGLLGLGASTASAQILFDVKYNPTTNVAIITSTGAPVTWSVNENNASSFEVTAGAGIYFETFFKSSPPVTSGTGGRIPISGVDGGLLASSSGAALLNEVWDGGSMALNIAKLGVQNSSTAGLLLERGTTSFNTLNTFTIDFGSDFPRGAMYSTPGEYLGGAVTVFNGSTIGIGSYTYSVVPEPSTYAAIAGALGLGYAVYRRRRQAAAAPVATA